MGRVEKITHVPGFTLSVEDLYAARYLSAKRASSFMLQYSINEIAITGTHTSETLRL